LVEEKGIDGSEKNTYNRKTLLCLVEFGGSFDLEDDLINRKEKDTTIQAKLK